MGMPVAGVYDQDSFARVADDGGANAGTQSTKNANTTESINTTFRVRFLIQQVAPTANTNLSLTFDLYYSYNSGAYTAVPAQGATSAPIRFSADSQSITDGATTTDTGLGSGSFISGEWRESDPSGTINFTSEAASETEMEFCVEIYGDYAGLDNGDTIDIRVYTGAAALDTYTNTYRATVTGLSNPNTSSQSTAGSLTLTGQTHSGITTEKNRSEQSAAESLTLTGQTHSAIATDSNKSEQSAAASLTLTGQTHSGVTTENKASVQSAAETLTLTGQTHSAVETEKHISSQSAAETLTLAGQTHSGVTTEKHVSAQSAAGSLTLSGQTHSAISAASNFSAQSAAASLTLTGQTSSAVTSEKHISSQGAAATLTLAGQTHSGVTTEKNVVEGVAGSLTLTGQTHSAVTSESANNTASQSAAATLTLTGQTHSAVATDSNVAEGVAGSLTLTGQAGSAVTTEVVIRTGVDADGLAPYGVPGLAYDFNRADETIVPLTGVYANALLGSVRFVRWTEAYTTLSPSGTPIGRYAFDDDLVVEVDGVSATGIAATITDPALDHAYGGAVYYSDNWYYGRGVQGVTGGATVALEGVAGSTALGSVVVDLPNQITPTGVEGTAAAGTLSISTEVVYTLTGVAASAELGTVIATNLVIPEGVGATASVGSLSVSTSVVETPDSVVANALLGTVTTSNDVIETLSTLVGTTGLGTLSAQIPTGLRADVSDLSPLGVPRGQYTFLAKDETVIEQRSEVSDLSPLAVPMGVYEFQPITVEHVSVELTGLQATGAVAIFDGLSSTYFPDGIELTGSVAELTSSQDVTVELRSLSGSYYSGDAYYSSGEYYGGVALDIGATAELGEFILPQTLELTGVAGTTILGGIAVQSDDSSVELNSQGSIAALGTIGVSADVNETLTGVEATGQVDDLDVGEVELIAVAVEANAALGTLDVVTSSVMQVSLPAAPVYPGYFTFAGDVTGDEDTAEGQFTLIVAAEVMTLAVAEETDTITPDSDVYTITVDAEGFTIVVEQDLIELEGGVLSEDIIVAAEENTVEVAAEVPRAA